MKTNPLIYLFLLVFISCNDIKKETEKDTDSNTIKKELTSYNYVYEGDLERAHIKHRIVGLKEEYEVLSATSPNDQEYEHSIVTREEIESEIFKLTKEYDTLKLVQKGILPIIPPPPPPPPVPCLCFDVFNKLNKIVSTNDITLLSITLTDTDGKKVFSTLDIKPQPIIGSKLVIFELNTDLEKFTNEGYLTIEKTMKNDTKKTYDVSVNVHPIENKG